MFFRNREKGSLKFNNTGGGYNNNGFDCIVSLGYNCEVSFRIEDYIGRHLDSYPLSWAYIHDQSKTSDIIEHLDDMLSGETTVNIRSGMIWCGKLNVSFHTKISHSSLTEDNKEQYVKKALPEMKARFSYLRKKFNELFQSNKSTLFVLKCQEINKYDSIIQYLDKLEKKISDKYLSGKFFLLVVTDDRNLYNMLKTVKSNNRGCSLISGFADDADTKCGGDIEGWLETLNYFNHIKDITYNELNYEATTISKNENRNTYAKQYMDLKAWCDELQEGKDWIENQWKNKCKECDELRQQLQDKA